MPTENEENKQETLLELYKIYHDRLKHEYDISWQQIKIFAYISGMNVGALGLFMKALKNSPLVDFIIILVPFVGFFIALSSFITFFGSLKTAEEIRDDLAAIERKLNISQDIRRYDNFTQTYSDVFWLKVDYITFGKMLLQIILITFWAILIVYVIY